MKTLNPCLPLISKFSKVHHANHAAVPAVKDNPRIHSALQQLRDDTDAVTCLHKEAHDTILIRAGAGGRG